MESGPHKAGVKRLAAALLLAVLCFGLGYAAGHTPDDPLEAPPPEGMELWRTLAPEQLANVTEGKREQISDLRDDIARIQEI